MYRDNNESESDLSFITGLVHSGCNEQRQHRRTQSKLVASFELNALYDEFGTIVNISCGGALLSTSLAIKVGDRVIINLLDFQLESNSSQQLIGRAIHVSPLKDGNNQVGIEFASLSEDNYRQISALIDEA
jgi:hypothetical protein